MQCEPSQDLDIIHLNFSPGFASTDEESELNRDLG